MRKSLFGFAAAAVLMMGATSANAVVYTFNANLNGASQVPALPLVTGSALATLSYDNMGTANLADDTFSFSMFASGLTGAPTGFHIHAAAPAGSNAGVKVFLDQSPFLSLASGTSLLVGGSGVATPYAGFLSDLTAGLAYVNIHTAAHAGGEIRGQLIQVSAVPEPTTYALMLAGLGMVGLLSRRRQR